MLPLPNYLMGFQFIFVPYAQLCWQDLTARKFSPATVLVYYFFYLKGNYLCKLTIVFLTTIKLLLISVMQSFEMNSFEASTLLLYILWKTQKKSKRLHLIYSRVSRGSVTIRSFYNVSEGALSNSLNKSL